MMLKVHIYNYQDIPLDVLLSSTYISELERLSFQKYTNLEVKKEKVISSILKNKYIGEYYLNEFGKPLCKDKYFNISHSHGLIAFVMDDVPVGIDIEKIKKVENDLINYISNDDEKKCIHDDESFYEIWTNKEALVKSFGTGIKSNPKEIIGLPINGRRIYKDKVYFNKTIKHDDYVITVSRQIDEDFDLEIIKESI